MKDHLLSNSNEQEIRQRLQSSDDLIDSVLEVPIKCVEQAKEVGKFVVDYVVDHSHLPHWLIDNEYLISGHRPPMPSVKQCFASIFRLHTETVNIWTHLLGTLVFIIIAIYFLTRPATEVHIEKKLIFGAFFLGAIVCLLCSTLYHTLYCHSPKISKIFWKVIICLSFFFVRIYDEYLDLIIVE
jgi:adiponectin receptor